MKYVQRIALAILVLLIATAIALIAFAVLSPFIKSDYWLGIAVGAIFGSSVFAQGLYLWLKNKESKKQFPPYTGASDMSP